jgi:hypothetical protein
MHGELKLKINIGMFLCVPTGECLRANNINPGSNNNNTNADLINLDYLRDAVKVTCNNNHCNVGQYMHRECFDAWEQTVLIFLKSCGRARSCGRETAPSESVDQEGLWTCIQNLWLPLWSWPPEERFGLDATSPFKHCFRRPCRWSCTR